MMRWDEMVCGDQILEVTVEPRVVSLLKKSYASSDLDFIYLPSFEEQGG